MNIMRDPISDAIADLPIEVRLLWPSGQVQQGVAKKDAITQSVEGERRLVTITFKVTPHDHMAAAREYVRDRYDMNTAGDKTMTYTPEDFAKATLATRWTDGVARRVSPESDKPWRASWVPDYDWLSDEEMADKGWTPVMESRITEHTLRDQHEKAERKRQKLLDHIASLEAVIRRHNDQIERQAGQIEKVRVARDEAVPLSLDVLRAAWENAEVTTDEAPLRRGDTAITQIRPDTYTVGSVLADMTMSAPSDVRVLSRAPQREPWQDLAALLTEWFGSNQSSQASLEQFLYERGVRVTGGDEL